MPSPIVMTTRPRRGYVINNQQQLDYGPSNSDRDKAAIQDINDRQAAQQDQANQYAAAANQQATGFQQQLVLQNNAAYYAQEAARGHASQQSSLMNQEAQQQGHRDWAQSNYADQRAENEGQRNAAIQQQRDWEQAGYQTHRDKQQEIYEHSRQQQQFLNQWNLQQGHGTIQSQLQAQHGDIQSELQSRHGDIQANLMQTQLTISEQQRLQRLREGVAYVQQDQTIPESARRDMLAQLFTGLSPLQSRQRESQMLTEQLHQQQMQQQNQQQATLFQQRQNYLAGNIQSRLQSLVNPQTGEEGVYYVDEHGNPQPVDFGQLHEQRRLGIEHMGMQNTIAQNQVQQLPMTNQMQQLELQLRQGQIPLQEFQRRHQELVNEHLAFENTPAMRNLRTQLAQGQVDAQGFARQRSMLENEAANRELNRGISTHQEATLRQGITRQVNADPRITPENRAAEIERQMNSILQHFPGGGGVSQDRWNSVLGQQRTRVNDMINNNTVSVPAGQNQQQFVNNLARELARSHVGLPPRPAAVHVINNPQNAQQRQLGEEWRLRRSHVLSHHEFQPNGMTRNEFVDATNRAIELINQAGGDIHGMDPDEREEYRSILARTDAALVPAAGRPAGQPAGQPARQPARQPGGRPAWAAQDATYHPIVPAHSAPGAGNDLSGRDGGMDDFGPDNARRFMSVRRSSSAYTNTMQRLHNQGFSTPVAELIADAHHNLGRPLLATPSWAAERTGVYFPERTRAFQPQFVDMVARLIAHGMSRGQAEMTANAHFGR